MRYLRYEWTANPVLSAQCAICRKGKIQPWNEEKKETIRIKHVIRIKKEKGANK